MEAAEKGHPGVFRNWNLNPWSQLTAGSLLGNPKQGSIISASGPSRSASLPTRSHAVPALVSPSCSASPPHLGSRWRHLGERAASAVMDDPWLGGRYF